MKKVNFIPNPDLYGYGITIDNKQIVLKTEEDSIVIISDSGVTKTTRDGAVTKITANGQWITFKPDCSLCDNHHGCDNCYYGQVESKELHPHCEDCEHNGDEVPTQWKPLGDTYCRKCGRKLRPTN